jgi:hypothetical protein
MSNEKTAPGEVAYWSDRERWAALGRKIGAMRDEAKKRGVPLVTLRGAPSLITMFKALGKRIDKGAR